VDRRKPLLINKYEEVTDKAPREVVQRRGMRVCPKVALSETLNIDRSGLSSADFTYALKATFDFVVADGRTSLPEFAVEFDGPLHGTDPASMARDRIKNAICRLFELPLLRIDATWLRPIRRFTLLAWLIEVNGLYWSWAAEQEAGRIPWAEEFYWPFIIELDDKGRIMDRPYDLALPAMLSMGSAYERGLTSAPVNETVTGEDDKGYTVAYSILPLSRGGYVIETARSWSFRFPPVSPRELTEDLATVATAEALERYERGDYVAHSDEQLASLRELTADEVWIRQGCLLSDAPDGERA
jgi:hypothetical protein